MRPRIWMKGITQEILEERIEQIKDPQIRQMVACLVWYDFMGERLVADISARERGYFEPYLNASPVYLKEEQIIPGLRWVGYPKETAGLRARRLE